MIIVIDTDLVAPPAIIDDFLSVSDFDHAVHSSYTYDKRFSLDGRAISHITHKIVPPMIAKKCVDPVGMINHYYLDGSMVDWHRDTLGKVIIVVNLYGSAHFYLSDAPVDYPDNHPPPDAIQQFYFSQPNQAIVFDAKMFHMVENVTARSSMVIRHSGFINN